MAQDTLPILFRTYHVTGAVSKSDHRDIKQVTKSDESGSLVGGINVNCSCHYVVIEFNVVL